LPERTSETVDWETPARLATSTLVTFRDVRDGAPVTWRGLREFEAIGGLQHERGSTGPVIRSTFIRMTHTRLLRSPSLLARSALVTVLLAGCAGTAASHDRPTAPPPARVAVLAGPDATFSDISGITDAATGPVAVRRVGGSLEAQAIAAALAAEGYDTVIGVGAQARAAVGEAEAGEVGEGTRWASVR
jgi:hypothetical protein